MTYKLVLMLSGLKCHKFFRFTESFVEGALTRSPSKATAAREKSEGPIHNIKHIS